MSFWEEDVALYGWGGESLDRLRGCGVRSCSRRGADGESDLEPTVLKTPFVRIKRMVVRVI